LIDIYYLVKRRPGHSRQSVGPIDPIGLDHLNHSDDELLTNISIYWFTQTIGSSMRLYWESRQRPLRFAPGERVRTPVACAPSAATI